MPPTERMEIGALPREVAERVYEDLRAIARSVLRRHRCPGLLQTTALVHEAWLRLRGYEVSRDADGRVRLGALAAHVLRSVLVSEARREGSDKRGGGWRRIAMHGADYTEEATARSIDLLDLDEALNELAKFSPRRAEVVELRYFGGMSALEAAEHLGLSKRTIEKEWEYARAWLRVRLMSREGEGA